MNIRVIAIGRLGRGPEQAIVSDYLRRMRWPVEVRELEERRPLGPGERRRRETALLLAAIPDKAVLIVCDRQGDTLSSEAFAERIRRWRDGGVGTMAILIGGAEGLEDEARRRADLVLAFGAMTWPHRLVRCMLMEQLFRAEQILAGHPYHRG